MKKLFYIACFMVAGLFLKIDVSFADDGWIPSGPTVEDMRAATKVENLAIKGSREDKLISAVKNGDLKNVETFIADANLEARDNENMTVLMIAVEKGHSGIVRILLDAGADINAKDKVGCTAFFKAADKNYVDIVKMLMDKGAAADSAFEDVFVSSVFKGNTEMVKVLIVENARIQHRTLDTAYMMALNNRRCNPELFDVIAKVFNEESQ
jgi:ankyrin repeat protein